MSFKTKVEDNILVFTFDYQRINSISFETLEGLNQAVKKVNREDAIKGLILTGEGRVFSTGFDLGTFIDFNSKKSVLNWFYFQEDVIYNLFTCRKPVLAAINGHATAAGMIVSMAADYRISLDHPKIKVGMTEIHIGLSLTSAEAEIMRFGLGTDKNFRDIIFSGKLISPAEAVEKRIFDELCEEPAALIEKAKAKVCALIDTPGRPFILLKHLEKRHAAETIKKCHSTYDWDTFAGAFLDDTVQATLKKVKESMA